MRALQLIALLFLCVPGAWGQGVEKCDSYATDTFRCAAVRLPYVQHRVRGGSLVSGVVLHRAFIRATVCRLNGSVVFAFGNEFSKGARLDVDCEAFANGTAVHGRRDGRREGLWVPRRFGGMGRKVTLYEAGLKRKELYFWPNGQPKQLILYLDGKRRRSGARMYNLDGTSKTGPM